MSYLEKIGKNAKKAFEDLKSIKHEKIKKVLDSYNKSLLTNKKKINPASFDPTNSFSQKEKQRPKWPQCQDLSI